jgi:hypothetical protein
MGNRPDVRAQPMIGRGDPDGYIVVLSSPYGDLG